MFKSQKSQLAQYHNVQVSGEESNPRAAARMEVLGRGTGPRGEKMAAACPGVDSQDLATILDPFRAIFVDLGPDRLSAT